jgi:hypothetical protein
VINADNGTENSGARTQWLKRLVQFSAERNVRVQLAYYPPYHSKYNPIERVFGVLENYWNGDPLLSVEHAMGKAAAMTYKKVHPQVSLHPGGTKGVKLSKQPMQIIEQALKRTPKLGKWFVNILPAKARQALRKLAKLGN